MVTTHSRPPLEPGTRALLAATLAVLGWASAGCGITTPPDPGPPATKASLVVSHTIPSPSATAPCKGTATWKLTPVSLTGADGTTSETSWSSDFTDSPVLDTHFGPTGHACVITDIPSVGLRTGTWRFTTVIGIYRGTCEVHLHAGANTIGYHEVTKCSPS